VDVLGKHLLLVGGGHAHLTAISMTDRYIRRGHRVTLVSPGPYHYYSGMGPGLLSGTYRPQDIRFHVKRLVENRGGEFIEGRVTRVDPDARVLYLANGDELSYDVVSFNTGSDIVSSRITVELEGNVFPVKPISNLLDGQKRILGLLEGRKPSILIIGGGPAGLEIAGNAGRLVHDRESSADIRLLAGYRLLSNSPAKVRRIAKSSLENRGIEVVEGSRAVKAQGGEVTLADGRIFRYDVLFLALGVGPSAIFRNSGMPTAENGGLIVNSYLQSDAYPNIFGGGDCIEFRDRRLDKVGVYAVRENPILYENLMAALGGGPMKKFSPQETYILIFNLGDGRGIFWRKNWVWSGRLAFALKDYIDRRFMRRFQLSGELTDSE
jgi:NADH dehydrogenase FAD-containing subunit